MLPSGVGVTEGNAGTTVVSVPVHLSGPMPEPVTIDWSTVDVPSNPLVATGGTDFVAASGTVTFAPGETTQYVEIEVLGDTVDEPPLLYGEWGIVSFSNPVNATLDTSGFWGLGLFIIIDDD